MSFVTELIPPRPAPAAAKQGLTGARIAGISVLALWALLAAGLVLTVINGWNQDKFLRYGPRYLHGLWTTISLVGISVVLGAALSVPIAFARMSKNRVAGAIAYAYVYVFRSTPLLAQLFLIYYGLGQFRPLLQDIPPMSNFRPIDRQTGFLLPPSVDEWLPEKHLARFVVEVIDGLDLRVMRGSYRGSGSASYPPSLLLGILVYGYATGVFSSRKLERASYDSVAFRFIAANQHPDHDTPAWPPG